MESQTVMLLKYLKTHRSITPIDALTKLGIYRLSARIFNLRRMGYKIDTLKHENVDIDGCVHRYAEYRFEG